jgi:hypothetical protein
MNPVTDNYNRTIMQRTFLAENMLSISLLEVTASILSPVWAYVSSSDLRAITISAPVFFGKFLKDLTSEFIGSWACFRLLMRKVSQGKVRLDTYLVPRSIRKRLISC